MSATVIDRNTMRRDGNQYGYPMKAGALIPAGVMVALAIGLAISAVATATHVVVGVSEANFDNTTGGDGDEIVRVRRGTYHFGNSASTDAITLADVGSVCYVVDNQTVAKSSATGTRPAAGLITDVDANGVWVKF